MAEGAARRVTIVRDRDGIAHVRADDLDGAFFGQGYAAAQDRLWQLEYDRRRATGRLAELVGPRAVGTDRFHRRLDLAGAAQRDVADLSEEAARALAAYAAGVTARLDRLTDAELPPELALLGAGRASLEPWQPWHSLAVFKVRHLLMGTYEIKLWRSALVRNLGPEQAARLWPSEPGPTVVPSAEEVGRAVELGGVLAGVADVLEAIPGADSGEGGSNNLAIHGTRTASGLPLLAGDPHRALDLPNVYWQNHLTCPEVSAIGLSFPGVPGFPHFGHNAEVAWCITHGMADDQDVFVERLRPSEDGGVEYQHEGQWRQATVREALVAVAGAAPVPVVAVETHRGPIVAGDADLGVGLSLRWTALAGADSSFDALLPMMRAATVAELDEAMRPWAVPVNNLLMADRSGSIAYRLRGRLAIRPPANGWTAVAGWDGEHDWQGWVPFEEQPRVVDPPGGFLVTANNRPAGDGPYVSNDFAHPARAHRLIELVGGRDGWDVASVLDALLDERSLVAPRFVAGLLAVAARHPLERQAQELLAGWDFTMSADSAAAAVYAACRMELLRLATAAAGLAGDRLGIIGAGPTLYQTSRFLWTRIAYLAGDPGAIFDGVGGWPGACTAALRWAVRSLEVALGPDPSRWRWGALHTVRWVHPLAALRPDLAGRLATPAPVETGGDADSPRATGVAPPSLEAVTGSVARYVFDLADWDRSVWVVPHGVAGDPRHRHHTDQLAAWSAGGVLPMRWSAEAVDAATESSEMIEVPAGVGP